VLAAAVQGLGALPGALAADHEPPEEASEREREQGQHDQHNHRDGHGGVGGAARGALPGRLPLRDQLLELLGLKTDAVDQLFAERGRRDRARRTGVACDLGDHARHVVARVGACGVGQRVRPRDVRALLFGGLLERDRGGRQLPSGRLRRSEEQRLARDHIAPESRLRVDHLAFDVDRRREVRAGTERRLRGRAEMDDVPEQQRDPERHHGAARGDGYEHARDQPGT